ERYPWPGNVRELINALERAVVLGRGSVVDADNLPDQVLAPAAAQPTPSLAAAHDSLEDVERVHVQRILAESATLEEAALRLGINPTTLWRKRRRWGLERRAGPRVRPSERLYTGVRRTEEHRRRPSPEALLQAAAQEHRSRLKIFAGAAPGVGKTYAMLQAAQERRAEGVDVVVGVVETHGRQETAALLHDLEVVPKKRIE